MLFKTKKYYIAPMKCITVYPDIEAKDMIGYPEYILNLRNSIYDKLH